MTFYQKRVFPTVGLGFAAVFLLTSAGIFRAQDARPPFEMMLPFFTLVVFMGVVGYVLTKKLILDLVDEVWDAGSFLLAKNKGLEENVSLTNIMNISHSTMQAPPRVTLTLRQPGALGREIAFIPKLGFMGFVPFYKSPIVDDLIRRVDDARRTS